MSRLLQNLHLSQLPVLTQHMYRLCQLIRCIYTWVRLVWLLYARFMVLFAHLVHYALLVTKRMILYIMSTWYSLVTAFQFQCQGSIAGYIIMSEAQRPSPPITQIQTVLQSQSSPDQARYIEINRLRGHSLFLHLVHSTLMHRYSEGCTTTERIRTFTVW